MLQGFKTGVHKQMCEVTLVHFISSTYDTYQGSSLTGHHRTRVSTAVRVHVCLWVSIKL